MTILLNNHGYGNEQWRAELERLLPDAEIQEYPEVHHPERVKYALVWNHPKGDLKRYPNLAAVLSLGAGTEHFVGDLELPDVPIVRLVDPAVAHDMAVHSLFWVINFHRHYYLYAERQKIALWQRETCKPMNEFRVGVLGLGNIGARVAETIVNTGYSVLGWDTDNKSLSAKIDTYSGESELFAVLEKIDTLINCLPLTEKTRGMIDASLFGRMSAGSFLVNVSRGAVVNEKDMLAALDAGHLQAAALDAFTIEPLPQSSPIWRHERVHITPHMSGATYARSAAHVIVENIRRLDAGETAFPLFNRALGY